MQSIDIRFEILALLETVDEIECALLYGSVARGDVESHSDVDILLICKGRKLDGFAAISSALGAQAGKYSFTLYTRKELEFMTKANSLFMIHLKRESVVLFDRSGGFWDALLHKVQAKASYAADFTAALSLLGSLESFVPGAPNQFHRLAHVYALFRVYGVYLLAEHGTFEFSKERMARRLSSLYPDLRLEIEALESLRPLNNRFHTGLVQVINSNSFATFDLPFYVSCLGRFVGRAVHVTARQYADLVATFLNATQSGPRRLDYRLRSWFLLLVYDGLNLFCVSEGLPPIRSMDQQQLTILQAYRCPPSIEEATDTVLRYLKSYPLKYFLRNDTKIDTQLARRILRNVSLAGGVSSHNSEIGL